MGSLKTCLLFALALSALPASARIYCCNDEHGRRICGDILPAQCQARAYNELNAQGVVKKKVEAPLTPEQRAQRDAELARKKAEEHAAAEQARRDKAMLASYTSVADIDAKRVRTVAGAQADIKTAQERLEAAEARREKLLKSAERYGDKPMPEALKANLRDSETELVARQANLADKKKELVLIEEHFDHDRRRFLELTGKHPGPEAAPAAPAR
jgi:hypothetical protein